MIRIKTTNITSEEMIRIKTANSTSEEMNDKHEGKVEKIEEWVDESSEGKGSSAEEGESSEGEDSDEEEEYIRKHFAVEQEKTKKQCNEMHLIKKFDNNSINLCERNENSGSCVYDEERKMRRKKRMYRIYRCLGDKKEKEEIHTSEEKEKMLERNSENALKNIEVHEEKHERKERRGRVLVIVTGGTICMTNKGMGASLKTTRKLITNILLRNGDEDRQMEVNEKNKNEEKTKKKKLVPNLKILEWKKLIDSSDINESHWFRIGKNIQHYYSFYDGFVVLHGTDTLAYTASMLSFIFENLKKPVVITGSMLPAGDIMTDAKRNMHAAFLFAAYSNVPKVVVVFGSKIMLGSRTTKVDCFGVDAFDSPNCNQIGRVGINMEVAPRNLFNSVKIENDEKKHLKLTYKLNMNIGVFTLFPSIDIIPSLLFFLEKYCGIGDVYDDDNDYNCETNGYKCFCSTKNLIENSFIYDKNYNESSMEEKYYICNNRRNFDEEGREEEVPSLNYIKKHSFYSRSENCYANDNDNNSNSSKIIMNNGSDNNIETSQILVQNSAKNISTEETKKVLYYTNAISSCNSFDSTTTSSFSFSSPPLSNALCSSQFPRCAVILRLYGNGTCPSNRRFLEKMKSIARNKKVILIGLTQCMKGSVMMNAYDNGASLVKLGVISAYDMTMEAAIAKIAYLLGKGYCSDKIREEFTKDLRGEVTPTEDGG